MSVPRMIFMAPGIANEEMMPMIAITISISIREKAERARKGDFMGGKGWGTCRYEVHTLTRGKWETERTVRQDRAWRPSARPKALSVTIPLARGVGWVDGGREFCTLC